jgi:hypothetical protein
MNQKGRICSVEGCDEKHLSKGFCVSHYKKAKRSGLVGSHKRCTVESCESFVYSRGVCEKHYQQITRCGGIKRTQFDPNDFWFEGDKCFIRLFGKDCQEKAIAIIDKDNFDRCKIHKWGCHKTSCGVPYVSTQVNGKNMSLHHLIIGYPQKGFEVDHISRDTFDNRKENLRFCTRLQNVCNVEKYGGKTSKYKGVSRNNNGKWSVYIRKNGNQFYLGSFSDELDAAITYNKEAKRLHGDFAYLNAIGG